MSIPFTQYMRPDGRKVSVIIERDGEIEALANAFISAGGWYEVEHLTTGHASLTACMNTDEGPDDIEIEVVPNGPGVGDAVDRLVQRSVEHVGGRS